MAGDWIKMQIDLPDKPKVIALASRLDLDVDSVVGKLHRLWGWADRQTTDGNAPGVTAAFIDSRMGVTGFASALEAVGWLEVSPAGVRLVKFEEHNGKTAKTRALTGKRVANHKQKGNGAGNGASVTSALPREEKRREEDKTDTKVSVVRVPEGAKPKPPVDPLLSWPSIRLYRDKMHVTPSAGIQRDRIAKEVEDLELWGRVLDAWLLRGFKKTNVEGLLNWYHTGIPEWGNANHGTGGNIAKNRGPALPLRAYATGTEGDRERKSGIIKPGGV